MARRSSSLFFLPFAIFAVVGVGLAATSLFPSQSGFESLPTGPGTLGDILTHYFSTDGSAKNSAKLGGLTATGYLATNGSTCNAGEVWKGVNQDGKVICGPRGALLAVGKFSEITGNIQVRKGGAGPWTQANTTDILQEGDIIKTDTTGSGTIRFVADSSIVRLDTNTVIMISRGMLASNTVPQIEVTTGKAWGRVLTSTGVNIGGGGLVAGVRGTSVSVENTDGAYRVTIIDSQRTDNTLGNATVSAGVQMASGAGIPLSTSPSIPGSTYLLSHNTWINQNTRLDIAYLNGLKSTPSAYSTAIGELQITEPSITDTNKQNALCNPNGGTTYTFWQGMTDANMVCQESNKVAIVKCSNNSGNKNCTIYSRGNIVSSGSTSTGIVFPSTTWSGMTLTLTELTSSTNTNTIAGIGTRKISTANTSTGITSNGKFFIGCGISNCSGAPGYFPDRFTLTITQP